MDEEDAPKITEKPTAASKAPATIRKTRANARAESKMPEPMVVSAYKEVTDTDEDEAPKVMVKSKAAGMKPKTMRKTRGQNVLGQIAEAGTQEEQEFYDAEEVPVKAKNDKVESEGDEEQVPESVKPVKKRGRPAKKALNDDDLMVIEEGMFGLNPATGLLLVQVVSESVCSLHPPAAEETVKTKRGRKPKKAQPPKIKQEEIEDSEDDHETLDQKLATLSLGQMTRDNTDEPVKPKPKQRGRPRKNNQTKKNASLDVSGLDLALTYFIGIRDLAMGDVDDEDVQKVLEMAKQGMETIQAALDGVKEE